MDAEGQKLMEIILDFDEDEVIEQVQSMIKSGIKPITIADVCKETMDVVGQKFQEKEFFLTELIMAGELLKIIMEEIGFDSSASADDSNMLAKILIGTVEGDVHDIGKNIVSSLLVSNNFKIIDIGVDVKIDDFVSAIKENKPEMVAMCGLLTLAYDSMKGTIDALKTAGIRDDVKIMIGGGATDEKICEYVGADAYGKDAIDAVTIANKWIN